MMYGRAVSADHVMFNECIPAFWPAPPAEDHEASIGYLLLNFELTREISLDDFTIYPTRTVHIPNSAYAAFVAPVNMPPWIEPQFNGHLFLIALSAVLTFAICRPVKSPRDIYTIGTAIDKAEFELAIQYPVLTAGPGCHLCHLADQTIAKLDQSFREVIAAILALPYRDYVQVMQAIRLFHLAQLMVREDFALAHYLLVSAIESIAQKALSRKKFARKHPKEEIWQQLAKSDQNFKELLAAYRNERGKQQYLWQRFVEFIMRYCPPQTWEQLESWFEDFQLYLEQLSGWKPYFPTKKAFWDVYPSDLAETKIREILADAYTFRSNFTHRGEPPPYKNPISFNRFFDVEREYDWSPDKSKMSEREWVLPNFRLMSFIARNSILAYAQSSRKK